MQDLSGAAFPAVEAPSNDELARRIEAESAKTDEAERAAQAAASDASSARTTGLIGIVVGAIGIAAGLGALVTGRRRAP